MRNFNKDIVYSIDLKHVGAVISITLKELGVSSVLIKNQDFQVVWDSKNLFIRLNKELELQKSPEIEILVLDKGNKNINSWKVRCQPKG